uniref:FAD-binding PCMH-type domain-containing protein n=1 Tax=Leersia perrieri TaxID=77586 RepID=A0A0D9WR33_9ORYZ
MAVSTCLAFVLAVCCCYAAAIGLPTTADSTGEDFLRCLAASGVPSKLVVTQDSPSFTSTLTSSVRNPRFLEPGTVRPLCIVTPTNSSHVQDAVVCGRRHNIRIRVRSGGHDYEGLSYRSVRPEAFAVFDLAALRAVRVDRVAATAWVDSGATVGELYYVVAKADPELAFPAGLCPTIGIGGHFSGGGIGMMMRKYGLSSDNVLDATVVDANGRLLDKKAMGEDLFWAIRGGGGESFGIVLSWKVMLVAVPRTVTVSLIVKSMEQGAVDLVTKWQTLVPVLPDELTIRVFVQDKQARFQTLYLGTCDKLLPLMSSQFPELGMTRADCQKMSWVQSMLYLNGGTGSTPLEDLLNKTTSLTSFSKYKSDYVNQAISKASWEKIFPWFDGADAGLIILEPQGGRVGSIGDDDTPYPHRAGVLYNIQYISFWPTNATAAVPDWIRNVYGFMEPFVSCNPRAAYVNYRDLDLGENEVTAGGVTSYESGRVWGEKYFGVANFRRLALTKGMVDPGDYFRNEQSVPPLVTSNSINPRQTKEIEMATFFRNLALAFTVSFLSCHFLSVPSTASPDGFVQCLLQKIPGELVLTQSSSSFTDVLVSTIHNPTFFNNATARPLCIVTPTDASHVQAAVRCGRAEGVRLRARSGGHDYEGLSFRSARGGEVFAVVDVGARLRAVNVSVDDATAWVESGATLGDLYYAVAKASPELAFPAGVCPTIGVGGHFTGGGISIMSREYGLSVDNILDAKLVNAHGALVDRAAMGEDYFWAIRGGGGESFGIVVSWKIHLVKVPPTVAVFGITKTVDEGAADVVATWQHVTQRLPNELSIRVTVRGQSATFQSLYLGSCDQLLALMSSKFPEMEMTSADCHEMSWLQSVAFIQFMDLTTPVEALLNRTVSQRVATKPKSDFVRRAIPKNVWTNIFSWFAMNGSGMMLLEPMGGFMDGVPAAATPYPHRAGVLYNIQYIAFWLGDDTAAAAKRWVNDLYAFMEPYVSSNPREAYVNFRDLDIGENAVANDGVSTFESGKVWGEKYFAGNFERLAAVKAAVDPTDYFRNEQSIPPLLGQSKSK